ncbi:hypothetical protein [Tenacibaculum finnmarkense]|uniref:hypothetical protein n=1 Tax=Tenacibaculum finnmarkense TaxID=2781243 RepID=UPI001E620FB7|nr:hypothetical protein [Tenacibaculum finnmarkense]MCD8413258.1 hypothetical protein [Tenacibaculum finnmarkense genomovar ulcerans]MCG8208226.1 RHS repeat protein [Tenacibaculum finnmarkense genomovar finnmarkense]MCG8724212.1 RHS repeat protein [Tenacibaculum finnmarkense]MCG8742546.1 RHS repeat protein [Tenacibaculum finnmarkense]MCG8765950.1 RHS repeat protein [Tenacibaculum finnmarkense]
MRKFILSGIVILLSTVFYAQELRKIIPPSPTTFELGKYGDIPINESTGMANINIPLFNYSLGKLGVDISLNYITSGIKVNQIASWVGMGWNLNAGGFITRTIRGNPDELYERKYNNSFDGIRSLYQQNSNTHYKFLNNLVFSSKLKKDYEPDLYNFNVGALSGSFILDDNGNPLVLKQSSQIKVIKTSRGFEITSTKGVKYIFESCEFNKVRTGYGPSGDVDNVQTSWFLSSIKGINGDIIYFNYVNNSYSYTSGYNMTFLKSLGDSFCDGGASASPLDKIIYSEMNSQLQSIKIASITNNRNKNKLEFISSTGRADLPHGSKKLNEIKLYDNTKLIKSYQLSYDMIISKHPTSNKKLKHDSYKKRLFLKNIEEFSNQDNSEGGKIHRFEYNDTESLCPRYGYAQDLLGFYNGKNSNSTLLPRNNKFFPIGSYRSGDRSSNFIDATKGILKKIVYPTKGFTSLEYEPTTEIITEYSHNEINFRRSTDTNLSKVKVFELNNLIDQTILVKGTVTSDGNDSVHNRMVYIIKDLTDDKIIYSENVGMEGHSISPYLLLKENHTYEFTIDLSSVKMNFVKGELSFLYKSSIKENILENKTGIRVKKIIKKSNTEALPQIKRYYYNKLASYTQESLIKSEQLNLSNTSEKYIKCAFKNANLHSFGYFLRSVTSGGWNSIYNLTNNLNKYKYVTISFGGDNFEGGGIQKKFRKISNNYNYLFGNGGSIPNSPTSNEAMFNGTLLQEISFKKENNLFKNIKKTDYLYELDTDQTIKVNGYVGWSRNPELGNGSIINVNDLSPIDLANHTFGMEMNHYFTYSMFYKLKQRKIIDFLDIKNHTVITDYNYSNKLLKEEINYKSTGEVLKTKSYYPDDKLALSGLSEEASTAIAKLKEQHRIVVPIQVKTYKNDVLQTTQRTNYKDWGNNIVLPKTIQTLKGISTATNILEDRVVYHNYDEKGNLIEVSKKDGTKVYYVWGYQQTQPIAKITGYSTITEAQKTVISNAVIASNADKDEATENNLRAKLKLLRKSFDTETVQVNTYTYDPLIGVTSITDPRGQTIYYEYDTFNRLEFIKGKDGNILKENKYNYKN